MQTEVLTRFKTFTVLRAVKLYHWPYGSYIVPTIKINSPYSYFSFDQLVTQLLFLDYFQIY